MEGACSLLLGLDIQDWNFIQTSTAQARASLQESPAQILGSIRIPARLLGNVRIEALAELFHICRPSSCIFNILKDLLCPLGRNLVAEIQVSYIGLQLLARRKSLLILLVSFVKHGKTTGQLDRKIDCRE